MYTAMGVAAGACVMFWAFGPGILLLYLKPRRDWEAAESPDPDP